MGRLSPAWRWALIVTLAALALAALNVWWFSTYRDAYPFDIDEAGYTGFGFADFYALHYAGVHAWWDQIQGQGTFAPLVPAIASLLLVINESVLDGFVVLTGFMVLLVMATYGIGLRLVGPRLGALAALVTATLPGTFIFSREFIYALPSAAFLSCAVFALLRSDGLRSRRWSVACGAGLGLLLLTRTMTVAYIPGVLAAAAFAAYGRSHGDLGRRALNFALLVAAAAAVAATWYLKNLASVVDYLTSYGYGKQAKFYGEQHALISWGRFRSVGEHIIGEDLFLPLGLVILAALVALAVVASRGLRTGGSRTAVLRRFAASDVTALAVVVVIGYAGLMSSRNGGNGFTIPLSVLLPPLAVVALQRFPSATVPALAVVVPIALLNTISTATVWSAASHTRSVSVPGFHDAFPITKGQPKSVFGWRAQIPGAETVFVDSDKRWLRTDEKVVEMLNGLFGPTDEPPVVMFASRSRAISSNAVQLASLVNYKRAMPFLQLVAEPNNSVANYLSQFRESKLGEPTAMISIVPNTNDFPPLVSQRNAGAAARRLGMEKTTSLELPDGRRLYLWTKPPQS